MYIVFLIKQSLETRVFLFFDLIFFFSKLDLSVCFVLGQGIVVIIIGFSQDSNLLQEPLDSLENEHIPKQIQKQNARSLADTENHANLTEPTNQMNCQQHHYKAPVDIDWEQNEPEDCKRNEKANLIKYSKARVAGVLREHILIVQENVRDFTDE